jgi:hypothetical protein
MTATRQKYYFSPIEDGFYTHEIVAAGARRAKCALKSHVVYFSEKTKKITVCGNSAQFYELLQADCPDLDLCRKALEVQCDDNDFYLDENSEGIAFTFDGSILHINDIWQAKTYRLLVLETEETEDATRIKQFVML